MEREPEIKVKDLVLWARNRVVLRLAYISANWSLFESYSSLRESTMEECLHNLPDHHLPKPFQSERKENKQDPYHWYRELSEEDKRLLDVTSTRARTRSGSSFRQFCNRFDTEGVDEEIRTLSLFIRDWILAQEERRIEKAVAVLKKRSKFPCFKKHFAELQQHVRQEGA